MTASKDTKNGTPSTALEVPEDVPNPLIAFVDKITHDHLLDLRAEIARQTQRLRGLRRMESVAAAALGMDTHKKKSSTDPKPDRAAALEIKRRRVGVLLSGGPRNGQEIITKCGVAPVELTSVMDHPWFSKGAAGYYVTSAYRQAVGTS